MSTTKKPERRRNNVITTGCDICLGKNYFAGMQLRKCRTCHVHVHPLCYGHYAPSSQNEDEYYEKHFDCWACRAVGKEVHARELLTGKLQRMTVRERPTECCLCGVDNGTEFLHAMHPIYDYHEEYGRQVILPAGDEKPERLAWAHSLCCFALCSHAQTKGCVYGCRMDGSYEGIAADNEELAAANKRDGINPDLVRIDATQGGSESIHHFAYWGIRNSKDDEWTRTIRECQALKCRLCGQDDKPPHVLRIPVQCSANSESEFEDFAGKHADLGDDDCYEAIHVGCAIWKKDDAGAWPKRRRVFFHPGQSDAENPIDPVINVFCTAHAKDLKGEGGAKVLRYPEPDDPVEKPQAIMGRSATVGTVSKLSPVLQKPTHPKLHQRSASLSALIKKNTDPSSARRSSLQTAPSLLLPKKTSEKITVAARPSTHKQKDGEDGLLNRAESTSNSQADPTPEAIPRKGAHSTSNIPADPAPGAIPRKGAVAHSSLELPAKASNKEASLGHVPRKRPAAPASEVEPNKKQKLSAKAKQKNVADNTKKKKGDSAPITADVEDTNVLSPQARLKPGKKKKAAEGEQKKKKKIVGDLADQSSASSAIIRMERNISESKCHAYDNSELERKYLKIVDSLQDTVTKFVYSKETLDEVMDEKRPTWEKQINAPKRIFNTLWSKVENAVSKTVDFSGEDWSFLVVGKNFDLGKKDFSQWDSYEVINATNDDMSV